MKTVKNIFPYVASLTLLLIVFLTGCATPAAEARPDTVTPEEIVELLCTDADVPPYETVRLDASNFEYYAFVPYDESLQAVAADALVNITPHSLVVIRAENGNASEIAANILKNADPNKWLCVGAETVNVAYTEHYVVLIMSYQDTADAITENFKTIAPDLDTGELVLLTASNPRYEP